ncbi:MAG: hypothetical protein DRJ44_01505 [Thermoprotei archaeon]|nr:AAA family ATPase [Thermoproteales archaeon]RLE77664.1 MAG: hypothetical protein DRJ44_01505 [Thermoprotei archaeon]
MIFKDRNKLSPKYVPLKLPHREGELSLVEGLFRDIFPAEETFTRIIQLQGPAGVGKTSVAFHVGRKIEADARERNVDLKHVYVNMKLESTSKFVMYSNIARKIDPGLVSRSVSAEELLGSILRYLKAHNKYVILTIDEIDYYLKTSKSTNIIFDLTKMSEIYFGEPINILGLMFIARDPKWRKMLNNAELSSLGRIVVNFKPYTKDQVFDIIDYRASEAFEAGAISDEVLEYIAEVTVDYANGDIRYALDIMLYAGTLAENRDSETVTLEHVRTVLSQLEPHITSEDIMNLNSNEKILLLTVAEELKARKTAYVDLEDVWERHFEICEYYGFKKFSRREFNQTIQMLYNKGLLDLKGLKIGVSNVPVEKLVGFLDYIINRLKEEI